MCRPATLVLALGGALTAGSATRAWSQGAKHPQPPIHTHAAPVTSRSREVVGRYEYSDPASGLWWAIELAPEGTAEIFVNGQAARTTAGAMPTFRYRVLGRSLYLWDSERHREQPYGSLTDSTLPTVDGWRFGKRT
jgi:hypothetical protein